MQGPLLTVLMPVYNAERFLKEAIESILCQSLKNFEFLIIDDGSTDKSVEIVRSYTDPRIRFIQNEENLGITATLNKGIEASSTELIARMDADDISYPDRLEKQYQYFQLHPDCVLLSTWAREITEEGETILVERFSSSYYHYILNFHCWIYHPTVMYRKSAVKDVGMYSVPYCEDFNLWWQLSRKYETGNLAEVLVDYRSTKESLSRVVKRKEYDSAHHEQVARNIRYYTGENFKLTEEEVECLRGNCKPLLSKNSIKVLVRCIKKLDFFNKRFLEKEKERLDETGTYDAMHFKRQYVITNLTRGLSKLERLQLYLMIGNYQNAFLGVLHSVKKLRTISSFN